MDVVSELCSPVRSVRVCEFECNGWTCVFLGTTGISVYSISYAGQGMDMEDKGTTDQRFT